MKTGLVGFGHLELVGRVAVIGGKSGRAECDMSVLCVANFAAGTGYSWWLMENFWREVAQFCSVDEKCFVGYPSLENREELSDVVVQRVRLRSKSFDWRDIVATLSFLRRQRIALVYLTDHSFFSPHYLLWRMAGVRYIVTHSHVGGEAARQGVLRRCLKRALFRLRPFTCDAMICVSEQVRRRNSEISGVPSVRCATVENGVPDISVSPGARRRIRKEMGIPEDALVMVSTGRAHVSKRIDTVLAALGRLPLDAPPLYFIFCGDGPVLEELRDAAREMGIAGHCFFAGNRADVAEVLAASDIAVHPSAYEGFSLSILEYMRAGLPVILPDRPSVAQTIRHRASGIVYSEDKPDALCDAIRELTTDDLLRRELGQESRREYLMSYTLEACNERFARAWGALGLPFGACGRGSGINR